ncbi:hypothetical protein RvY_12739 [Ramazzottius varieornatus]|uniref:Uncharacterized protein n=1 Tax=Ramazzottius varieornatus TaxID=947166 RepID=A0A1D1VQY6_RAMVA|nr:hypothetical protein RvY_12739 [Ramazzottius varieornatus]
MSSTGQNGQKKGYNRMGMLQLPDPVASEVDSPKLPVVPVQQGRSNPSPPSALMEWEESTSKPEKPTIRFPSRNSSKGSEEEKAVVTPEPTSSLQNPDLFQHCHQPYNKSSTSDEQSPTSGFIKAQVSAEESVEGKKETKEVNEGTIEEVVTNQEQAVQEPTVDSTKTETPSLPQVDPSNADGVSKQKTESLAGLHEKRDFLVGPYSGMLQLPRTLVLGMAIEELVRVFGKEFHDWLTDERAIKLMNSASWEDSKTEPGSAASSGQVFRGLLERRAAENSKARNAEPNSFRSDITSISGLDVNMVQDLNSQSSSLGSASGMLNGNGAVKPIPFRLSPELYSQQFSIESQEFLGPPPNSAVSPYLVPSYPDDQATRVLNRAVSSMSQTSCNSGRQSHAGRPLSSLSIKSGVGKRKAKRTAAEDLPSKKITNLERARSLKELLLGDQKPKLPNVRVVGSSPTSQVGLSNSAVGFKKSSESIVLNPEVPEFIPGRLAMNLPSVESPKVSSAEVIAPLLLNIPAVVNRMEVSTSPRNDKVKLTDDLMDHYKLRQQRFKDLVTRKKMTPEDALAKMGPPSYPELA